MCIRDREARILNKGGVEERLGPRSDVLGSESLGRVKALPTANSAPKRMRLLSPTGGVMSKVRVLVAWVCLWIGWLIRVLAIYQIQLGWKTYRCYETDELPNPKPTQPKKN